MSIKYDSKREPLAEIIKKATINATYVILDLQRPYVWSPRQVSMLVDSLFRGWRSMGFPAAGFGMGAGSPRSQSKAKQPLVQGVDVYRPAEVHRRAKS